jgi:hypothetical protein
MGFPAWCTPETLESLESFLERVAQEMSYTEKNWLETLPTPVRLHQPNLIRAQATFRSLAELMTDLHLDVEALFLMTLHRFASVFYLPGTWPEWPAEYDDFPAPLWEAGGLERYAHGRGHGKVCPLCWREQPALLLPWSLRPITTCLKHQIMLVDHCPAGQHNLVIDQRRGRCATCGCALAHLPVTAPPAQEKSQELTHLLWTAVGCGDGFFPPPSLTLPAHSPLRHMSPAACLHFFWQMGHLLVTRDPTNPLFAEIQQESGKRELPTIQVPLSQANVEMIHTVLVGILRLLKDWPDRWYETLERLVRQEEPLTVTAGTCFPAVLMEHFPGQDFRWLHRGWRDFLWRVRGRFVQLAPWLHYARSIPREKPIRRRRMRLELLTMPQTPPRAETETADTRLSS